MEQGYRAETTPKLRRRILGPPIPPMMRQRRIYAVPLILTLNLLVFMGWSFADRNGEVFFVNHFVTSMQHLKAGHFWTLLTAAFSHQMAFHILFNMIVLYSFGSILERFLGTRRFVIFYLIAAVVSSLAHCLTSAWMLGQPGMGAVGASGALTGVLMVFAILLPRQSILLFGIIPIPALVAVLLLVGFDIYGLISQSRGGWLPIGHAAHLGGSFTGLLYYGLYLRKHIRIVRQPRGW